jgi:hypothetical protein
LLFSLGPAIPGAELLAGLPLLGQLRIPPRALFLALTSLAVIAAHGFDFLISSKPVRASRVLLASLAAFTGIFAVATQSLRRQATVATLLLLAIWVAIEIYNRHKLSPHLLATLLIGLLLVDTVLINQSLIKFRGVEDVVAESSEVALYLESKHGLFRVYSPSYSLAQQSKANIQRADGVDPLQMQTYADFMEVASGVPAFGYSVTLPPFANGDPSTANANFSPDPDLLGLLNVEFLVSDFPLKIDGLAELDKVNETYIYKNERARPRAWVQSDEEEVSAAEILIWTPNQVVISAFGPGRLILSEVDYPGWVAQLDGNRTAIEPYAGILRSVVLTPGKHEIAFQFLPGSLLFGWYVPLAIIVVLAVQDKRKK